MSSMGDHTIFVSSRRKVPDGMEWVVSVEGKKVGVLVLPGGKEQIERALELAYRAWVME